MSRIVYRLIFKPGNFCECRECRAFVRASATLYFWAAVLMATAAAAADSSVESDDDTVYARIQSGIHYVDGRPVVKTAAWWGLNHWVSNDPDTAIGNQLALKEADVGTERDFYAEARFNTGYFTEFSYGDDPYGDRQKSLNWLETAMARSRKTGQKLVLHFWTTPPAGVAKTMGERWSVVTETGESAPVHGFHYDPQTHCEVMREWLAPFFDAVRDEPLVIGYQIGGETWADISYDERSIRRFRDFLRSQYSLEALSSRYGEHPRFYDGWDNVNPPMQGGTRDFKQRALPNGRLAWYDWMRYWKKVHEDVWVAYVELLNELDGRGRPFSYEYNHGPFSGSAYNPGYNFNFAAVCERTRNFSVGPGEFAYSLAESMHGLYTKTCGQGPWFSNELGPGYSCTMDINSADAAPAYLRRHTWWTLALGGGGYHIWTFFNLLGAYNEFTAGRYFDPVLFDNLPPVFFEARHGNEMIRSLGDVLAGSVAPPLTIGLFYLEDSSMAGYVGSYKTDAQSVLRALAAHHLADQVGIFTEHHLRTMDLQQLKAIVLPRTPRLSDDTIARLAKYVEQGGTLLLMTPTGHVDEYFREAEIYPAGLLAEVCGVQVHSLPPAELSASPVQLPWRERLINLDVLTRLSIPPGSTATTLAQAGQEPAATAHDYGKGRCIVLAGRPLVVTDDDPTGDFLVSLLKDAGVAPAAALLENDRTDTGVYVGRRLGPKGTLLICIENEDRAHPLTVRLDPTALALQPDSDYRVFECFSDEAHQVSADTDWSFPTTIEPVGVRVYLVTAADTAEAVLPADRMLLPRDDPDHVLYARPHRGVPAYRLGDAHALQQNAWRVDTMSAGHDQAPRSLGDGFLGLNLDALCTDSLSAMLKNVDYSSILQFGAKPAAGDAGEVLPLKPGINWLGDVPVWVNGRYIKLGKRRLQGIRVDARVAALSFFHHSVLWLHESTLGFYQVNYADGASLRIPIALFTTLSDLDRCWGIAPKTTVVWTAKNGNRLSRYDWINPYPEKVVASIDVVRTETGSFDVWAITAQVQDSVASLTLNGQSLPGTCIPAELLGPRNKVED